jgi:flagellin
MRINNNISALNTYRHYTANTSSANKSMEKLSSGLRINRGGDDAAGLAISEKDACTNQRYRNGIQKQPGRYIFGANAEGALTETQSILQRMRELSVQSASDTNEDIDRDALQAEFEQLKAEIDDISDQTKFNNMQLLTGTFGSKRLIQLQELVTLLFLLLPV